VKKLTELVINVDKGKFDVEGMTVIDNGDYQGTLIFAIPRYTYQPNEKEYIITYVDYGSCSACDTLESIRDYDDNSPSPEQVQGYMTLALHILQRFKWLYEEVEV
jgi:hypothetical protein